MQQRRPEILDAKNAAHKSKWYIMCRRYDHGLRRPLNYSHPFVFCVIRSLRTSV